VTTSRNKQKHRSVIISLNKSHYRGFMLKTLRLVAFMLLPMLLAWPASAETYPSRNVRLIVPFGAGGPADVYARILAQYLSEETKQAFVVEDRPGAGALIGTDAVAKSTPDG
jgi:tripartite-type tricarboxylate transporter receptor subunit TctC